MRHSAHRPGIVSRLWYAAGRVLGVDMASAWARQVADWLGYETSRAEVTRPVAQNVHVYRGVAVIANTIASLPPVLRRGGEGEPLERGPALDLLRNPDRTIRMTWRDLAEELAGYLVATGAAYVLDADYVDNPRAWTPGPARRLLVVGGRQMTPKYAADGRTLLWWELRERPGATPLPILPTLAPYIRLFNPDDPWTGLSPLEAAALGIKQDYKAAVFGCAALDNGGQPGGLYVFENLTDEQRAEYQRLVEERHAGVRNANKPGVVSGLREYVSTSFNMVDLALLDSRKLSREEIFEALGVPPVLGCVFDAAHYNVADAAQEIFLLNTIVPIAEKIGGLLTVVVDQVEPGVVAALDASRHPVMQRIERGKYDALVKLINTGVPYNEAVNSLGLPFGPQKWGDTSLLVTTLAPADEVVAGLGALPTRETEPTDEEPAGADEEETERPDEDEARLGRPRRAAFDGASIGREMRIEARQVRAAINPIRQRFRSLFIRQERALLARLRDVVEGAGAAARRPWERADADDAERIAARVLLRLSEQQAALRKIVRDTWPRAVEHTLRAELQRLGIRGDEADQAVRKVLRGRYVQQLLRAKEIRIQGVEVTTRRRVKAQLVAGLRRGENVQDLARRVRTVMGGADQYARALRIARTEAGEAVSVARFTAAAAAGASGKGWVTGRNPRPSHVQAGQNYAPRVNPIAMEQTFAVGADRLMYPRDPAGSVGETINCNCVLVTVRIKTDRRGARTAELVNALGGWDARPAARRRSA